MASAHGNETVGQRLFSEASPPTCRPAPAAGSGRRTWGQQASSRRAASHPDGAAPCPPQPAARCPQRSRHSSPMAPSGRRSLPEQTRGIAAFPPLWWELSPSQDAGRRDRRPWTHSEEELQGWRRGCPDGHDDTAEGFCAVEHRWASRSRRT